MYNLCKGNIIVAVKPLKSGVEKATVSWDTHVQFVKLIVFIEKFSK